MKSLLSFFGTVWFGKLCIAEAVSDEKKKCNCVINRFLHTIKTPVDCSV